MEVDGKQYHLLGWEEEYCRYYDIDIVVYCNVSLRKDDATLIKIRWIDESEDVFAENEDNIKILSRYISGKVLLAVTDDYGFKKSPTYNYYTADIDLTIKRKEDEEKLIIEKLKISTNGCVRPDKTMKLHISGYNILPDELIEDESSSSTVSYQFEAPKSAPIKEYYYDEEVNEFIRFNHDTNTKEKTTLMVDIDPLTLELLQTMDPKGKKLLNIRLSNMVSEVIEEVNYLMNPEIEDED